MRTLILAAAAAVAAGSASAHDTSPSACQVEDWRWWAAPGGMLMVEGVATCTAGEMQLRLYDGIGDGRRFLGATTGFIEGHIFQVIFADIDGPDDPSIDYAIEEGEAW